MLGDFPQRPKISRPQKQQEGQKALQRGLKTLTNDNKRWPRPKNFVKLYFAGKLFLELNEISLLWRRPPTPFPGLSPSTLKFSARKNSKRVKKALQRELKTPTNDRARQKIRKFLPVLHQELFFSLPKTLTNDMASKICKSWPKTPTNDKRR